MAQPTAYVFRSAEDTLTFCYDAACESRNGDTWEIPEVIEYKGSNISTPPVSPT